MCVGFGSGLLPSKSILEAIDKNCVEGSCRRGCSTGYPHGQTCFCVAACNASVSLGRLHFHWRPKYFFFTTDWEIKKNQDKISARRYENSILVLFCFGYLSFLTAIYSFIDVLNFLRFPRNQQPSLCVTSYNQTPHVYYFLIHDQHEDWLLNRVHCS